MGAIIKLLSVLYIYYIYNFGSVFGAACLDLLETACKSSSSCAWVDGLDPPCVCASSSPLNIVFTLDSSGSLNFDDSQGNPQDGWLTERQFTNRMIEEAVGPQSNIAVTKFSNDCQEIYDWGQSQQPRSDITDAVMASSFLNGGTNMYSAMYDAYYRYRYEIPSGTDNNERLMVFMTDGKPSSGYGACANRYNVNWYYWLVTYLEIKIIVIGIGDGWRTQDVECLVDDPDSQIIHVDSVSEEDFDKVRSQTDGFLCPDSMSLKLTELRTSQTWSKNGKTYKSEFVEFYVDAATYKLDVNSFRFDGYMKSDEFGKCNLEFIENTFVVFYNPDVTYDDLGCFSCDCTQTGNAHLCDDALYIPCNSNSATSGGCGTCSWNEDSMTNDAWAQYVYDFASDELLTSAVRASNDATWINIKAGYSAELISTIYSSDNGAYWAQSCNYTGTPGAVPLLECGGNCDEDTCKINGDSNATCHEDLDQCQCTRSNHYYRSKSSGCLYLEAPINCQVDNSKLDKVGTVATIGWLRPGGKISGVKYEVQIDDDPSSTTSGLQMFKGFAIPSSRTVIVRSYYDDSDFGRTYSASAGCAIVTIEPTDSPTPSPTPSLADIDQCTGKIFNYDGKNKHSIEIEWSAGYAADVGDIEASDFDSGFYSYWIYGNYAPHLVSNDNKLKIDQIYQSDGSSNRKEVLYPPYRLDIENGGMPEINVIVVVLDESGNPDYDRMRDAPQTRLCILTTPEPTPSPTKAPTNAPTDQPTKTPTETPTASPVFAVWSFDSCQVTIQGGSETVIFMKWSYNIGLDSPRAKLFIEVDGEEKGGEITNEHSELETEGYTLLPIDLAPEIITPDNVVKGYLKYRYSGGSSTEIETNKVLCTFITAFPTPAPTDQPTKSPTDQPTNTPTDSPSPAPTDVPTPSPTRNPLSFDGSCVIEISRGDTVFEKVTFIESDFNDNDDGLTIDSKYIKYVLEWQSITGPDRDQTFEIQSSGNPNEEIVRNNINAGNGGFDVENDEVTIQMVISPPNDEDIVYSTKQICSFITKAPTGSPTTQTPTKYPTTTQPIVYFDLTADNVGDWGFDRACSGLLTEDDSTRRRLQDEGDEEEETAPPPLIDVTTQCFVAENNEAKHVIFKREPENFAFDIIVKYMVTYFVNEDGDGISSDDFDVENKNKNKDAFVNQGVIFEEYIAGGASNPSSIIDYFVVVEEPKKNGNPNDDSTSSSSTTTEAAEAFKIELISCSIVSDGRESVAVPDELMNFYQCAVGVPGTVHELAITIEDLGPPDKATLITVGELPTWIWYPIGAAGLLIPILSYLIYRFYNAKKIADALEIQRKAELQEQEKQDDVGEFGVIGDNINANPLATGDAFEIPKQDAVIDHQLAIEKMNFEVATTEVEHNIFKQDFGPVQAEKNENI